MSLKSIISYFQTNIPKHYNFLKRQLLNSRRTVGNICICTVLFSLFLFIIFERLSNLMLIESFNMICKLDVITSNVNFTFLFFTVISIFILLCVLFFKMILLKKKNISLKDIKRNVVTDLSLLISVFTNFCFLIFFKNGCLSILSFSLLCCISLFAITDLYPVLYKKGKSRGESEKLRYNSLFLKLVFFYVISLMIDGIIEYNTALINYLDYSINGVITLNTITGFITAILAVIDSFSLKSAKVENMNFCGISLQEFPYYHNQFTTRFAFKFVIIAFAVGVFILTFMQLIVPLFFIIINIPFAFIIYSNKDKKDNAVVIDNKKKVFKISLFEEIDEFQEKNNLDYDSTYFQRILKYNFKYEYEKKGLEIDCKEELQSAYEAIVECIDSNIQHTSSDKMTVFLSNWKYIKYSMYRFMNTIDLDGDKKSVDVFITMIKLFIENMEFNNFQYFPLASMIIIIYFRTENLEAIILLSDKLKKKKVKIACLYFALVLYIYKIYCIDDDYDEKKVKSDIDVIFKKIKKITGKKNIDISQMNNLNTILINIDPFMDKVSLIIVEIQQLGIADRNSFINLIKKLVFENN